MQLTVGDEKISTIINFVSARVRMQGGLRACNAIQIAICMAMEERNIGTCDDSKKLNL